MKQPNKKPNKKYYKNQLMANKRFSKEKQKRNPQIINDNFIIFNEL